MSIILRELSGMADYQQIAGLQRLAMREEPTAEHLLAAGSVC